MIKIRKSKDRGFKDHGWLRTYHTFSFSDYYHPAFMGFRTLRVINEDYVEPGKGFGTHAHQDMEIITYVLEGTLAHKDSMGNGSTIVPGEVQRMTAGTGVTHSEFNHSHEEWVHLLQIWILPSQKSLAPSYEQQTFPKEDRRNQLCLIASPTQEQKSVLIHQNVRIFASLLEVGQALLYQVPPRRHVWIQVARGTLSLDGQTLDQGDGAALSEERQISLQAETEAEFLLFDLA